MLGSVFHGWSGEDVAMVALVARLAPEAVRFTIFLAALVAILPATCVAAFVASCKTMRVTMKTPNKQFNDDKKSIELKRSILNANCSLR